MDKHKLNKLKSIYPCTSFLFLLVFLFLPLSSVQAITGDYDKGVLPGQSNVLTTSDWNNLDDDFLNVEGDTASGPLKVLMSSGDNPEFKLQASATADSHWGIYHDRTTDDLRFWKDAADRFTFTDGGYLGIGTTNPTQMLEINNVGAADHNLILMDSDADKQTGIKFRSAGADKWTINRQSTTNDLRFYSYGITDAAMLINYSTGYVGIGLTNPSTKLEVDGTITATAFSGPLSGTLSAANVSNGAFGSNTGGGNYSFPGNVGIGSTTPTTALDVVGSAIFDLGSGGSVTITEDPTGATSTGLIRLGRSSDGWEGVYFDPDLGTKGNFVFTAPLSVAASSPGITFYDPADPTNTNKQRAIEYSADSLQLQIGDVIKTNFSSATDMTNSTGLPPAGKTFFQIGKNDLASRPEQGIFIGANAPGAFTGDLIHLQVGDSTRFRVTKFGDIIAGGQTMVTNGPVLNTAQTWNNNAVEFNAWVLNITDTASTASSTLVNMRVNSESKFRVDKAGNVYFAGDLYQDGTIFSGGSGGGDSVWTLNDTKAYYNGGNVGIGTSDPSVALEINEGNILLSKTGDSSVSDVMAYHTLTPSTVQSGMFRVGIRHAGSVNYGASTRYAFEGISNSGGYSSSNIQFWTSKVNVTAGTERMRITGNGNVGIGTTDPTTKLQVNTEDAESILSIARGGSNTSASTAIGALQFIQDFSGSPQEWASINAGTTPASAARTKLEFLVKSTSGSLLSGLNIYGTDTGVNVGIGHTAPDYKLRVEGTGYFANTVVVGTPTADTHATTKSYVDTKVAGGSGSTVGYWALNGSDLYAANTGYNVGIGNTSPELQLDVSGGIQSRLTTLISGSERNYLAYDMPGGGGGTTGYTYGAYILLEKAGIDDYYTFGTISAIRSGSSHGESLNIEVHSFTDVDSPKIFEFYGTYDAEAPPERKVVTYNGVAYNAIYIPSKANGRLPSHYSFSGKHVKSGDSLSVVQGDDAGITNVAAWSDARNYDFFSSAAGNFSSYKIGNNNVIDVNLDHFGRNGLFTGSVGVGVTNPIHTLQVHGDKMSFRDPTGVEGVTFDAVLGGSQLLYSDYWGGTERSFVLGTYTNKANQLVLDTNGRVGIGEVSPSAGLHVYKLGAQNVNAWFGGSFIDISTYHYDRARVGISGTHSDGQFGAGIHFQVRNSSNTNYLDSVITQDRNGKLGIETGGAGTTQPTEKMSIEPGGNVGIGHTNPDYKLRVEGTGYFANAVTVGTPTASGHAATKSYVDTAVGNSAVTAGNDIDVSGTTVSLENDIDIDFLTMSNQEQPTAVAGKIYFDENVYNNGYPFNGDGGGLSVYNQDGWGALISTTNMQWLQMTLDRLHVGGTSDPGTDNLLVDGTATAAAFSGPLSGTVSAANVSSGSFGSNTGGGNYTFPANIYATADGAYFKSGGSATGRSAIVGNTYQNEAGSNDYNAYFAYDAYWDESVNQWKPVRTNLGRKFKIEMGYHQNTITFDYSSGYTPPLNWTNLMTIAANGTVSASTFSGTFSGALSGTVSAANVSSGSFGSNTGGGNYTFPANVTVVGSLYTNTGGDFAEEFATAEELPAGTVVVIGDYGYRTAKECSEEYDSTVLGIVSEQAAVVAGRVESDTKVLVAMAGVVPVKVNDSNGQIKKGDLLTTSAVSGEAMKARKDRTGTIIGKALEDLDGDRGMVQVLVNLQ